MFGRIVFESGVLKHVSGKQHPFEMRTLGGSDMPQMSKLRDDVTAGISEWDMFLPTPDSVIKKGLENEGITCGTLVNDRLVGLRSFHFPIAGDPENIGTYAYISKDELGKVVDLKLSLVREDYRRNNLQKRMTAHLMGLIGDMGRNHLCAIVSPKNVASMRDKFTLGMCIKRMMLKEKSFWRCLFHLDRSLPLLTPIADVYINNRDFEGQRDLIEYGYWGFEMVKGENNTGQIRYAIFN